MKNTVSRWIYLLAAMMIMAGVISSAAIADPDRETTRLMREMRQVQAKLAAAQQENEALSAQVDALKKQISQTESKGALLEKKTKGQSKLVAELTEKYQDADNNLQQMSQLFSAMSESQQQTRMEKEQDHKRLEDDIHVCEKKNADLYQISMEMMKKYRSKGVITSLLQEEPFTGIEKVKVENLLQEYRDKADSAKFSSGSAPSADTGNRVQDAPRP